MTARDATTSIVDRLEREGSWNPLWDGLDDLDPGWTEYYLTAPMQPDESGVLPPQVVQLLCIAGDASCTHLYGPGLQRHIRAALDLGLTAHEILEVLELATTVGIHSLDLGVPILLDELSARDSSLSSVPPDPESVTVVVAPSHESSLWSISERTVTDLSPRRAVGAGRATGRGARTRPPRLRAWDRSGTDRSGRPPRTAPADP